MFNLRMDPYERAEITSNTYNDWMVRRGILGRSRTGGLRREIYGDIQRISPKTKTIEL